MIVDNGNQRNLASKLSIVGLNYQELLIPSCIILDGPKYHNNLPLPPQSVLQPLLLDAYMTQWSVMSLQLIVLTKS